MTKREMSPKFKRAPEKLAEKRTRREVLAGAAAVMAASALPSLPTEAQQGMFEWLEQVELESIKNSPLPPLRGSYRWLVQIGAAPPFHGTAAELAELDWSIKELPTLMNAVGQLARRGELDPIEFDPETARALRCCVLRGWAVEEADGRLRVTEAGVREYEAERLESYA